MQVELQANAATQWYLFQVRPAEQKIMLAHRSQGKKIALGFEPRFQEALEYQNPTC